MPKAASITKDMILEAAFELSRSEGFHTLSARSIAKRAKCSTQPIFWLYENMDVLKQEVKQKIVDYLGDQIKNYHKTGDPFLDMGLGYVKVAYTESLLFKAIYIDNILNISMEDIIPEPQLVEVVKKGNYKSEVSDDEANDIATLSWIFVHGLASLVATKLMEYDEEKIMAILTTPIKF